MADAPELGQGARTLIGDESSHIVVSAASLWEIAIKWRKGRLAGVDEYLRSFERLHEEWGFRLVVIEPRDAVLAGTFDFAHADPFDRMLIAQATRIAAPIVTCDEAITANFRRCVW